MNKTTNRPRKILAAWATAISLAGALHAQDPAGLWNFTNGDLAADVGQPLTYAGSAVGTTFGSTITFGIPNIGTDAAFVMKFDAGANGGGYRMPVSVAANGGGAFVNNYTVVMDVLFPAESAAVRRPLFESDLAQVNTVEGAEFYVSDAGEFSGLGNGLGSIAADTWYRLGIVVDGSANQVRLYVDGVEQGSFPAGGLDGRLALNPSTSGDPFAELFKDLAGATALGYVNSVQFRGEALAKGQMQALAGPSAAGIPATIPDVPSFVERWVPSEAFARASSGLGVVLNPGSSELSNFAMTLNGAPLTVGSSTDGDGNIVVTATGAPALTVLTDYALAVTYTDSKDGNKSFTHNFYVPLMYEDFELLVLGPNVDEGLAGDEVYSPTPPATWSVDHVSKDGQTPLYGVDPIDAVNGVTEFRGWTFLNKDWWAETAGNQDRTLFSFGKGTVAVADPDEWDDKGDPESLGSFNSKLITPEIDISAAAEGTVFLAFDSSTRSEEPQEIYITISYDGGAETEILRWTSNPGPTLKADAPNERISLPLNNPPGATTLQVTFGLEKAFNDWWWAIDNIVVDAGAIPPTLTSQPALTIKTVGESASFSVTAEGTEPFDFQWYRGTGAGRAAIVGATASTYTIASVGANDTDLYSVDVSNSAATVSSVEALLFVVPPVSPSGDIAGQWDFNSGDLSATIGADMLYFDGIGGQTAAETEFGTTTALGVPNIGGAPANVMKFAAANGPVGYVAALGGANGGEGAIEKNVYTLIFDVLWPAAANNQWRTFVQIDSLNNGNDGEFFVNTGNAIGVGATGYHGQLTADTWHRVVIAVDQSPGVNRVSYYIDGQFVGSGAGGGLDGRFGLPAAVNFFADNDGDARSGYISSLQVRNVALNALEAQALGAASAAGIPQTIDTSDLAPLIVTQPNAAFLSPGETLTLSVGALSGTAVTYQWYLNDGIINGATEATLTINNVLPSEAGNYKVVVSNGNGDTTSAEVAVSFPSGITQDLVVHLPFDADLNDTSGRGNNASTGAGATPLATGILGQAVNVSTTIAGGRNYVTLGAPADLNFGTATDFSVSFWVNSPGRSSDPGFIGNKDWGGGGNQGWILYASGNKLGMNIGPNRVDRGGAAQDPEIVGTGWHHVAAVFDRDGLFYAYVDGVLLGTANLAASSRNVDTPATMATNIGEDGTGTYNDITDGSPGFAQGTLIDDVGIWRRRLTPAEVAAIYQGGLSGQNLQLVTGETLGAVAGTAVSNGTSLQLDWRGQTGARLQRNPDVSNPAGWTDVPNTEGQDGIVVPINPAINEFFRLIRPEQP